jgi:hypothetical protein
MLTRIIAVALLCSGAMAAAFGSPADEVAIRANVVAFEAAWNKRDLSDVVATYAPDGDVVVFDGPHNRRGFLGVTSAALLGAFASLPPATRSSCTAVW